eukprot:CAMPEP_0174368868 /NCGR_PEP_ID=MMETSP0811_2-20130205/90464_1 /TAXON_ID=73025 ORGANISM="Eutreptiella gymnastica-like, Strain CCMP1594" /NCGR_SAMPLE_ID=MMETSP0811_2 /ASSEMBLY_ACC=CAM_ASM_000667 /LENGTH=142 /DNA_ID=CAMNT_0015512725 /DNA_START=975 /DNA_END=1404 /DNA_ORIENTATION=+
MALSQMAKRPGPAERVMHNPQKFVMSQQLYDQRMNLGRQGMFSVVTPTSGPAKETKAIMQNPRARPELKVQAEQGMQHPSNQDGAGDSLARNNELGWSPTRAGAHLTTQGSTAHKRKGGYDSFLTICGARPQPTCEDAAARG